jgi:hypothetical protein
MPKFMYIFRGGAFVSPTEIQTHLAKWGTWVGALVKEGHHRGGHPTQNTGKTIRGGDRKVTDGPYAESKDLVTGNLIVEMASLELATTAAHQCPIFEFDGSVEVRPILEQEM